MAEARWPVLRFRSDTPTCNGKNTLVELDGQNITDKVQGITIRAHVNEIATVRMEIAAHFDLTLPAEVSAAMTPPPGHAIEVLPGPNGGTLYKCIRLREES